MTTVGLIRVHKQSLLFTVLWLVWMMLYSLGRFHNYGQVYVAARYFIQHGGGDAAASSSSPRLCYIHRTKMDQTTGNFEIPSCCKGLMAKNKKRTSLRKGLK